MSLPLPTPVLGLQKHLVFTWVLTLAQKTLSPLSSRQPLSFSDILSVNCLQVFFFFFAILWNNAEHTSLTWKHLTFILLATIT